MRRVVKIVVVGNGEYAERLRALGLDVVEVPDPSAAHEYIAKVRGKEVGLVVVVGERAGLDESALRPLPLVVESEVAEDLFELLKALYFS